MTTTSGSTYFHYSGDKVVYETDASNNITAEYTYDPLGNPATMTKGGVTYYYHLNGRGDVVALTDGSGNTVAQYSYDAWGNILFQSGTMASANPLRNAGYRYDKQTGLYYLMARYYDPSIGRFITRDTVQTINLYNYTNNNPVNYIDADGHLPTPLGVALGIIGGIAGWSFGDYVAKNLGLSGAKYWAVRSAVMIGGAAIGFFAGELVAGIVARYLIANPATAARLSGWILSLVGYPRKLASKVASSVGNFTVGAKHLIGAGGTWSKFATSNQAQIRSWIAIALTKGTNFVTNSKDSYYIIYNMGRVIGTNGEQKIKVVFTFAGRIITSYPLK